MAGASNVFSKLPALVQKNYIFALRKIILLLYEYFVQLAETIHRY
jgi:hypothetical protein